MRDDGRFPTAFRVGRLVLRHVAAASVVAFAIGIGPSAAVSSAAELTPQRRAKVESLNADDKARLAENLKRFNKMDAAKQEHLRTLNSAVDQAPHSDELRRIMHRYHDWFRMLPPWQQAELDSLAPAERVVKVKKILNEQAAKRALQPPADGMPRSEGNRFERHGHGGWTAPSRPHLEDIQGLLAWFNEYIRKNDLKLLDGLPPETREKFRKELNRGKEIERNEVLGKMWLRWYLEQRDKLLPLTDEDLKTLQQKVSAATRKQLAGMTKEQQIRTVTNKLAVHLIHQQGVSLRPGRKMKPPTEAELADFFENTLNPTQRHWLLNRPGETINRDLYNLWWEHMKAKEAPKAPWPQSKPGAKTPPGKTPGKSAQGAKSAAGKSPSPKPKPATSTPTEKTGDKSSPKTPQDTKPATSEAKAPADTKPIPAVKQTTPEGQSPPTPPLP